MTDRERLAHEAVKAAWDLIQVVFDPFSPKSMATTMTAAADKAVQTRDAYAAYLNSKTEKSK